MNFTEISMMPTIALVGYTGFVGSNLVGSFKFDQQYNSRNIANIGGQSLNLVICAAAPATMWAANNDPESDLANINTLIGHLGSASIDRLVLISTIAVFDEPSAGYDEINCRYEASKAYGKHRRLLEIEAAKLAKKTHIIRLPALFGAGLKKNFIFDLLNPVPSFLNPEKFESLLAGMDAGERALTNAYFVMDQTLKMHRFRRQDATSDKVLASIEGAFKKAGFIARNFTSSESRFQYYGLDNLSSDIARCIELDIDSINLVSAPLSAAQIHKALTGEDYTNENPAAYCEDLRTVHADKWNAAAPYLRSADETLAELSAFYRHERGG